MVLKKLYRKFAQVSLKVLVPKLGFAAAFAFLCWAGSRTYGFVLAKTASNGWAWAASIALVLILGVLGAANEEADRLKDESKPKGVSRRVKTSSSAINPLDPGSGQTPPAMPIV